MSKTYFVYCMSEKSRRVKKLGLILRANLDWAHLGVEWVEDESSKAILEAKAPPVLRRQPAKN